MATSRQPSALSEFVPPLHPPPPGRPYGLIGLIFSTALMIAASLVLTFGIAALAFGVVALRMGYADALAQLRDLGATMSGDPDLLRKAGTIVSLVLYAVISGVIALAARFRGGSAWRDLIGWRPWTEFRGWRYWLLCLGTLAYALATDVVLGRYYPPSKDWIVLPQGAAWVAAFVVLAVVFAPVTEELLFRGWILTSLRAKLGTVAAILLTAVLFAFAHYERTHLYALAVFPVGVVLGIMRVKADSLKASMTFHALYNATAAALMMIGGNG